MARELHTLMLVTTAVGAAQIPTLWKSIKFAKEILEFIGECPEWINYNRNLEELLQDLRLKRVALESKQTDVRTELDNTERQSGKKRKREVDHWLRSVKNKGHDVKGVENSINSVSYLPRFLFRMWLGSHIGKETKELTELQELGNFQELLLDAPQCGGETFLLRELVGQAAVDNIDLIWSHLIDPRAVKIGVLGPEGIGKTDTVKEVYNRLCSCYRVYYIEVPHNFTTYSLQTAISSEMKVSIPEREGTESKRAARISNVLKSFKEFVFILDGLSHDFDLDQVGIRLEGNAGKVILTSRYPDVFRKMSFREPVVLQRLSREDSEQLFKEVLEADTPLSEEVRIVARNIVERCDGIPGRIRDMANNLRGVTDIADWQTTLNEM